MNSPKPRCSVVTVNWNSRDALKIFLKSLERYEDLSILQVIVSDNHSSDGSVEMLKKEFPYVELQENGANIGFGAANNRALELVKGDYILFANPDMEFIESGIEKLVSALETVREIGACGCVVLNADDSFMKQCRRGFPDPLTSFYYVSGLSMLFPKNRRVGKYFYTNVPTDRPMDVDALSGSFFLARKEALKVVGGFDESYFLFVEEVDLFLRMRRAGFRIRYLPVMKVRHHGGISMAIRPKPKAFYHYHMTRSHLILFAKERINHGGGFGYHVAFFFIMARYMILSVLTLNGRVFRHLVEFAGIHMGSFEKIRGER